MAEASTTITAYAPRKKIKGPVGRTKRKTKGAAVKNSKDDVRAVRYWLLAHGRKVAWNDKADAELIKAIEAFQKSKVSGGGVDGIVDPDFKTWKALIKATPKTLSELLGIPDPGEKPSAKGGVAIKDARLKALYDGVPEKTRTSAEFKKYMETVNGSTKLVRDITAIVKTPKDLVTSYRVFLKAGKKVELTYELLRVAKDPKNKQGASWVLSRMAGMSKKQIESAARLGKLAGKINLVESMGRLVKALAAWNITEAAGIITKELGNKVIPVGMLADAVESFLLLYFGKSNSTLLKVLRWAIQVANFGENLSILSKFSIAMFKSAYKGNVTDLLKLHAELEKKNRG